MAFQRAAGWNNLPNGNFSPVIFSKKAQIAFRKSTVAGDILNSDYFGEIANYGDSVRIIKEPEIELFDYARGAQVNPQDLDDEDFTLTIDQSKAYAFKVDDIEEKHAHHNWMSMASDRAGYRMRDNMDQNILAYVCGYRQAALNEVGSVANTDIPGTKAVSTAGADELLASMKLKKGDFGNITTASAGDHSIPVAARLPGATALPTAYVSPVMLINRMGKLLDKQNVSQEGRWIVIDPDFEEVLKDEDSRFHQADWGPNGSLRSGDCPMMIGGFKVYKSNNLPSIGTGAGTVGTANQNTNFGVIVAGHSSAAAMAEQMSQTESFRSQEFFGDVVRGMHLFGRKILRPEAIVTAKWNQA